ncbi:hypothetical protein CORC01_06907 [Colletotrichum orchidophilum]|uniref:Uncharacterized protein n=1 Tax=Colletotrichum orchidophilum TaxID=1209926 RepID=A0A1G4B8V3_9PEZI|nr:uncharacterized protein CORC01_06907 [Colletotrichum orchidophilum]OHE97702.1 hypothetical protein CORC01_06907 [Colletotrichum orchidophilum]
MPLAKFVGAQKLVVDDANEAAIVPAAQEFPEADIPQEAHQSTDALLANLTQLELSNNSPLTYADNRNLEKRAEPNNKCKFFPGDFFYP